MKLTRMKQSLSRVLCMVLIAAAALTATGCGSTKSDPSHTPAESPVLYAPQTEPYLLGEGTVTFPFTVSDLDGTTVSFEISTDADSVGEALEAVQLIEGEEGPYGLMVTTVNGIRHVFEEGSYWAFYIDGEYAMTGVDSTPIESGKTYSLQAAKA